MQVRLPAYTLFLLILTAGASGCASHSPTQVADCPVQVARELNDKPITVATSQGTTTVEPTVVGYEQPDASQSNCVAYQDDFERFNRAIFTFNDKLYRWVLIPVSDGYVALFPEVVRGSVDNFFSNIREPLNLLNHLLQFDGESSATSVSRFLVNSTIGILGLFDPAGHWFGLEEQRGTLSDTLAHYGAGRGDYLVLPVLGPSDMRGGFSSIVESLANPVRYVTDDPQTTQLVISQGIHDFSEQSGSYEELSNKAEDPYVFFRELYLQSQLRDNASEKPDQKESHPGASEHTKNSRKPQ
ncbi:MAG: VacJ family lipoprotein [Aestuariibacter sp.]